jgi:hypothetical protein
MSRGCHLQKCSISEHEILVIRSLARLSATAVAVVLFCLSTVRGGDASSQTVAGVTSRRTSWGDPDLQGTWTSDGSIRVPFERARALGERQFLTDDEFAVREERTRRQALAISPAGPEDPECAVNPPQHWLEQGRRTSRQTSLIVDPRDGRIPSKTAEAQQRSQSGPSSFNDGPFKGPEDFSLYDRCITRGVTGSILPHQYGNGTQIIQSREYVAIRYEMIHETRLIPLERRAHVGEKIRMYMGDSRGRWENGALVVETSNLTDKTNITGGVRHSRNLRLIERFARLDDETIQYDVTIDDPQTWVRPWRLSFPLIREAAYELFEYACHEGNRALPNILEASRLEEP